MKEFFNNNKRKVIALMLIVFAIGVLIVVKFYYGDFKTAKMAIFGGVRVVREVVAIPTTTSALGSDGRSVGATGEAVHFVSRGSVVIEGGDTVKESYALASPVAVLWSTDAKLVYVRSLGTVAVDGNSSGWELIFGSKTKKGGYQVVVAKGTVVQQKEIISSSVGFELPKNWYDGGEAIKSVQTLPQFKKATITGMNFYYNEDGKRWGYALSTSNGTVSIPVR